MDVNVIFNLFRVSVFRIYDIIVLLTYLWGIRGSFLEDGSHIMHVHTCRQSRRARVRVSEDPVRHGGEQGPGVEERGGVRALQRPLPRADEGGG